MAQSCLLVINYLKKNFDPHQNLLYEILSKNNLLTSFDQMVVSTLIRF